MTAPARLASFDVAKYEPEAQASGYLRGNPCPSLARRARIETLRERLNRMSFELAFAINCLE
jgi:hypothetical protein